MIVAAAFLALALQATPQAWDPEASAELSDVVVIGEHATGLLTVVVGGDTDRATLVTTEPDLRCGPEAYRWEEFGRPRLCWLRRRLDQSVVLTAVHAGQAGSDWTVDWEGCDRVVAADRCEVSIQSARQVRATFHTVG